MKQTTKLFRRKCNHLILLSLFAIILIFPSFAHAVTITEVYGAGGSMICSPNPLDTGSRARCTLLPDPASVVNTVSGCGGVIVQNNVYVTDALSADCTVSATFVAATGRADFLAGGLTHSTAELENGTVRGWGTAPQATVGGFYNVVALDAGGYHTLAVKNDLTVLGAGNNTYGQLNISGYTDIVDVGAGFRHTLLLTSGGLVIGIGGEGTREESIVPAGLANVIDVDAGYRFSMALSADGTLTGWGLNTSGQTTIPAGLSNVIAISVGGYHTIALKSDGTVTGWGMNTSGQTTIPAGLSNVIEISAGGYHSMALKSDGTVVAWGKNNYLQSTVPDGLSDVIAISASYDHSMALKRTGEVVLWGKAGTMTTVPSSLKVSITPQSAIDHGARWSIDSGATWYESGSVLLLPAATYTVTFDNTIAYHTAPADQSAAVGTTGTTSVTGAYLPQQYLVTPSAGAGGALEPATAQLVDYSATAVFNAVADTGYAIDNVTGCGGVLNGATYTTGAISADCTVTTSFTLLTYTVTPSAGAGGSLSPGAGQSVAYGNTTAFSVTSDTGYAIDNVTGCGGVLNGTTYTTGAIAGDCTVTASFSLLTYTVTPSAGAGGSLSPGTGQSVAYGNTTAFSVTSDTGYAIDNVTGCGGVLNGTTYTTGAIAGDCTVTALFFQPMYVINGTVSDASGNPISGAEVMIKSVQETVFTMLTTDASGYYSWDQAIYGDYKILARAAGQEFHPRIIAVHGSAVIADLDARRSADAL